MVQQLSDCTFYVCPAKGSAAFSAVSFGTITITGTAQAASLSPDPTGWKLFTFAGEPFQGGETLQFSDPGGADVPGFQHSIQAPFPVAITWPDLSASVTVVRSSGLPLSWTPAPFGKLNVTIVDGSHTQWLRCTFPAANGNATISPAALLLLDASNPNPYLGISTTNSALEDVGPWSVTFGASQPARLPNGMVAAPTIALQ